MKGLREETERDTLIQYIALIDQTLWSFEKLEVLTKNTAEDSVGAGSSLMTSETSDEGLRDQDDLGRALDGYRQYLLMIANEVIGPELQAKLGASDLVQDTFLEAQRHLAIFRGKTSGEMRAWLRKILECRLANIRRSYLVTEMRAASREVTLDAFLSGDRAGLPLQKKAALSPSNHAVRNECVAALERALAHVPEHYRQTVAWRHQEQLSWDEIGRRLGCTAGAARKVWCRAIERLRQLVKHESMR